MLLELENLGKSIKNTLKVLISGSGEGWRRSVGQTVWKRRCVA
jgi:hypothetical protein